MAVTIHGIRNCDTMRKAAAWLESRGIAYGFHDYRRDGLAPAVLQSWVDRLGWEALLNRAGTTFRNLPEEARRDLDASRAMSLMLANPTMIKRPVLAAGPQLAVGFKPDIWAKLL